MSSRYQYYRNHGVVYHWAAGTALSTAIMVIAFVFIVTEWCTQSHLSTANYEDAMQGLRRTRRLKRYTAWLSRIPNVIITFAKRGCFAMLRRRFRAGAGERRSLVWTWQSKHEDEILPVIEGIFATDDQKKARHAHIELGEGPTRGLLDRAPSSPEQKAPSDTASSRIS